MRLRPRLFPVNLLLLSPPCPSAVPCTGSTARTGASSVVRISFAAAKTSWRAPGLNVQHPLSASKQVFPCGMEGGSGRGGRATVFFVFVRFLKLVHDEAGKPPFAPCLPPQAVRVRLS
ncbi:hypothetical protein LZ30DRAFT_462842 [Colletotrichum cereale]|nr:hypothetical protein LZ30DRAFT_462842 [Colletotrichum cereale]